MAKKEFLVEESSKHRIESLTDGIFAFAMTLLVLSINIPLSSSALAGFSVFQTLLSQADRFINYAMSFLLLAIFWVSHHRILEHMRTADWKFIWLNVLLLLFIALIPFTTTLVNEFPFDSASDFLFSCNLFVIGVLYYVLWAHATYKRRLARDDLKEEHVKKTSQALLAVPAVSLFAMVLAFVYQPLSPVAYLAIPILLWGSKK
jgi:uncharacterized membrane protein